MADPGPILITGCSTGIGRATAAHLAGRGMTVYATARRPESLDDLAAAGATVLPLDVTDEASMAAAVERVSADHGAVGALVNNAGYSQSGAVESVPMDDARRQFETNVFGLMRMCQLVLPGMRERRHGRIVNISSMGANFTFPGGGLYHATKYAVEALSDALRFEVKGFGVDVVIVQPGIIRTNFGETAVASVGASDGGPYGDFNAAVAKATEDVYEKGPMAKLGGGPEKVAQTIERALTTSHPKIRYRVTPSASLLIRQRAFMTDGLWDRFLKTQFPQPGEGLNHAERSAVTRERLVRAGADLFARRGYRGASVQAIGEAAGISRGSIFWHFGSKEGLLWAVVESAFREWETRTLVADVGMASGLEAVRRALRSHRRFLTEDEDLLRLFHVLMFEALGPRPELRVRFAELHDHLREATEGWIAAAPDIRDDLDPRSVVTVLIGALGGLAYQRLLDPELSLAPAYATLEAIAEDGLRLRRLEDSDHG